MPVPYMEKYVIEALLEWGENYYGMERMKRRFAEMVNEHTRPFLLSDGDCPNGFPRWYYQSCPEWRRSTIPSQCVGITPTEAGYIRFIV